MSAELAGLLLTQKPGKVSKMPTSISPPYLVSETEPELPHAVIDVVSAARATKAIAVRSLVLLKVVIEIMMSPIM
jgi:hypothetical protein